MVVVVGDLDIFPRPATLPPITHVTMVDCLVYMNLKEEIVGVMVQDVKFDLKRSAPPLFTVLENLLIMLGEVDICLIPSLIPPIIQVILVYHQGFIFMVMTEVYISIRQANFLRLTMVN